MSGTSKDRTQGPIWVAQRMKGDEVKFLRRATEEDVEGQGIKVGGFGQTEEDVEGQGVKVTGLGQTEEDVEGQMLIVRINSPEDIELTGCLGRMQPIAPDPEDDVDGQGAYPGR